MELAMAGTVETITCNFIGDFKVGDNILRNANALTRLRDENENRIFNKLIVVQAGSIVEAALDQSSIALRTIRKRAYPIFRITT
jgi:hypothetical protein